MKPKEIFALALIAAVPLFILYSMIPSPTPRVKVNEAPATTAPVDPMATMEIPVLPPVQSRPPNMGGSRVFQYLAIDGPVGHTTITLDDASVLQLDRQIVPFSFFKTWDYNIDNPDNPAPSQIIELHEKIVSVAGFMFPLSEGENINAFMLMASTQTCCYGPRPEFNQFILTEFATPVKFERFRPVLVRGRLFIEPKPEDGYIMRMQGETIEVIDMVPTCGSVTHNPEALVPSEVDPGSIPFWEALAMFESKTIDEFQTKEIPEFFESNSQAELTLKGYIAGAFLGENREPLLLIGKSPWDGCCTGVAPNPFNSFIIEISSENPGFLNPDQYAQIVTVKGNLEIRPRPTWKDYGPVWLRSAVIERN